MLTSVSWSAVIAVLLIACVAPAHADATFLLQEPYGHFGGISPTGHAAIYFSRICAESPTVLRRCAPDETGAVISRYDKLGGYDWIAIPLIPYLYAVTRVDEIPSSIDEDTADVMRNAYRRSYLRDLAPNAKDDSIPEGNWVQLVGAAYNRKMYGFRIRTTEAQDDRLIALLNSKPNKSRFNLFFRNCADFARGVLNFYLPKAVHRSYVADMGLTTPKQAAKCLVKYNKKHPEVQLSTYVIPQVPGSMSRSTSIHGVAESLLKTKKYLVPLAIFHPLITGGVATAYFTKGRFNPARDATVIASTGDLPLFTGIQSQTAHKGGAAPSVGIATFSDVPATISQ